MTSSKIYPDNSTVLYERSTPMAKAVGVNLVNNPRNIILDAVNSSLSNKDLTKTLSFASASRFTYKVEQHKKILKNLNKETENPYPYGMLQSSISNTNYDLVAIKKDCESYVKREHIKVKKRLSDLVTYLNKVFNDADGSSILEQQLIINAMPDGIDKDTLQTNLNNLISSKDTIQHDIAVPLLNSKRDKIASLKLSRNKYFDIISLVYYEKSESLVLGEQLQILQSKWDIKETSARYEIKLINDEIAKLTLEREQLLYSVRGLLALKDNYTSSTTQINADESNRTFTGTIPELEDSLYLHTKWMTKKPIIELVSIGNIKEHFTPYIVLHNNTTFGISGFWGCETLSYKPNIHIVSGGWEQNEKDPDRWQIWYWEQILSIPDNTETLTVAFKDNISIPMEEEIFVVFNIIKNKYPLNYTRANGVPFYSSSAERDINYSCDLIMTKENSNYLSNRVIEEKINKEFHPPIEIKHKGYFDSNYYTEELLRNLYIDLPTTSKCLENICNTKYTLNNSDSLMQTEINDTKSFLDSYSFDKQRYSTSNAFNRTLNYCNNNPSKFIKAGILEKQPLSNNISDIYFQQGISLNTQESASIQYLIEFFSYLKDISKVDKEMFLRYVNEQSQDPDTNPRPYLLQNKFTIKNKIIQYDFEYSYIEVETLSDTWIAEDKDYKHGLKHNHNTGFAMRIIVPKPKKEIKYHQYTQYNYPTLNNQSDYHNREAEGWTAIMIQSDKTFYDESILELYYQKSSSEYTKVSIHGLKQTITRRPDYLLLPKSWVLSETGVYAENSFSYNTRRSISDVTINTLTNSLDTPVLSDKEFTNVFTVNNSGEEIEIIPTISNNLSAFIIPLWDHIINDKQYYTKDNPYSFNIIESVYQDSLNLLVFADLTDDQIDPLGEDKYWVGVEQRDKVLTAYLDNFISKYSLDQKEIKYEYLYTQDNDYPTDELYKDMIYHIGTAPNVSAYLPIPPNPFNGSFMTAMHRVSEALSSQQANSNPSSYEFLSLENKIFGDVGLQWNFKF